MENKTPSAAGLINKLQYNSYKNFKKIKMQIKRAKTSGLAKKRF